MASPGVEALKPDWERSKELFTAALALADTERARFLEDNCAGEPDLLRDLTELLASHDESEGFLAGAALEEFPGLVETERPLLEPGRLLGQYEVIRALGQGGMGEVYLANDRRMNRKVAVKLLPSTAPQNIRRFEQEVQTLSSLNHPNILTIHDFGSDGEDRFMVSEFVDGVTLSDRLKNSPLTASESLEIALQVLAALSTAHEAGIVHRDIKPENLMIRRDGLVKVLDFGVAKLAGIVEPAPEGSVQRVDPIKTNPGALIGSVGYMSPEQSTGTDIDARSDIFSFGVVLYEMIAGRSPFAGVGLVEVMEATRRAPIVPITNFSPGTSSALQGVINGCLEKDRNKRYQTARDVSEALRRVRSTDGIGPSEAHSFGRPSQLTGDVGNYTFETERPGGSATRSLEPARRSRTIQIALAAVFFVVVLGFDGVGYWMSPDAKAAKPPVADEAYQSYLRGRFFWNKRTGDDLRRAITEYEQALQIEPNYALAYVGLADCYTLLELYTGAPASETLPRAREYALRAIELDGSSSEAHTALGYVYYTLWQWDEANRHLKRAVELGPRNATAHHRYYLLLRETGRLAKASEMIARARELDPLSLVINLSYARSFLIREDIDTCVDLTKKLIELYPDYAPGHTTLGSAYIRQKRYPEAVTEMEKAVSIVRSGQTLSSLGYARALTGDAAGAEQLIKEMNAMFERRQILAREVALVFVGLGRYDEAFLWLEKDFENRSTELPAIVSMPDFSALRGDPRFADLIRRIGLKRN